MEWNVSQKTNNKKVLKTHIPFFIIYTAQLVI
jgi:hypothetical protein